MKNSIGTVAALSLLGRNVSAATEADRLHITLNQYTVANYYGRDGVDFVQNLDRCLAEMKSVGADGLEAMIHTAADSEKYGSALKKQDMELRSIYMSVNLHDKNVCDSEIERVLTSVKKAMEYGLKVIVINPAVKEGKTDAELILQSQNFDKAGEEIRKLGAKLTFHYHTTELLFAGREFHHLLCGTKPENLGLCFDVHWSFRASGNSAVAAYDHARLYGDRVVEFHLRQSKDGVWTELFGDGDIDYQWVADHVAKFGKKPHIVLEQAAEKETPNTMKAAEVFKISMETTRKMFDAYR
ncbi:MAG: sugar phosphate isomerase/epimerase [Planctomycetaceae bacterium]|nr:sugar phosphate isomerase/epimerase [Planctomycetaceae bacterium]